MRAIEAEARELTWRAWQRRHQGRLFRLPEIDLSDPVRWPRVDEVYFGLAVGVVPPEREMFEGRFGWGWREAIAVGVWQGIGPSWLGTDLRLTHFSGRHSTLHRSPLNVGFVYVLPERPFQVIARRLWEDEAEAA